MNILAIDPATKCGWAHSCGASGVWDLSVRRDESKGMRLLRLRGKLREVMNSSDIGLVVFEAARHAGPKMQGSLVVTAQLTGVIEAFCCEEGIHYQGYSSTEIKRHATGKGNAGKEMMLAAAREKWPSVDFADDNEADAKWLLDLAQTRLGEK